MMQSSARGSHVLITGGAGFIGTNLAQRLLEQGARVRILDSLVRSGSERNIDWLYQQHGERLEFMRADVRDACAVHAAIRDVDHVVHLAAQVAVTSSVRDPREDFAVNVGGTLNVLEAMRACQHPPSLVFTSTNKVYGALRDLTLAADGTRYVPRDEALQLRGVGEHRNLSFHSPYGCSKGAADQYVLDYAHSFGLRNIVLRMSCVYGPHQNGNEDQGWVAHFLKCALAEQPLTIYGDGLQVRDVLFVADLVDALQLAQQRIGALRGHAFNIGGGPHHTVSLLELLELIDEIAAPLPRIDFADWRTGDQRYYVSDLSCFTAATGWKPRTGIEQGLRALHAWLQSQAAHQAHGGVQPRRFLSAGTH